METRTLDEIIAAGGAEVVIDGYGHRGEGYARLADGWVSVRGALPGEKVRVRLVGRRQGRRVWGQIEALVERSPLRQDPRCPVDAECWGCQLRVLSVGEERAFKARQISEIVGRYAGIEADEQPAVESIAAVPMARGDGLRIRTSLSYRRGADSGSGGAAEVELGLHSPQAPRLISMAGCPALTGPVQRLVTTVEAALAVSPPPDRATAGSGPALERVRAAAPLHGHGFVELQARPGRGAEEVAAEVAADPSFAPLLESLARKLPPDVGLALALEHDRHHVRGPSRFRLPIAGLNLEVGYEDWFHATLEPAEALYAHLLELLELQPDESFLDAGCGIGTISLLAAPRVARVVGFDINPQSIEAAEINAMGHEASNARFLCGGWEKALRDLAMAGERFEVVTINPMREPLGPRALAYLSEIGARRLVYLGPSPVSAAKDLGELRRMGWSVDRLGAADLHPATYHAMLVARLRR